MATVTVDELRDERYRGAPVALRLHGGEVVTGTLTSFCPGRASGSYADRQEKIVVRDGAFVAHVVVKDVCEAITDRRKARKRRK